MTRRLGWMIAALLFALVPASGAQISQGAAPTSVSFAELAGYAGITICHRDQAFSFIATNLTALEEAEVRAHEQRHIEQIARFPSCGAYNTWYQTPVGRLEAEAEAYGAGWCKAVEMGADSTSRRNMIIQALEHNLGGEVNRLEVTRAVMKYEVC